MKKMTLAIMAAGLGSRFGKGIKQLEPLGPNGQIIMDYSIHDALEAGFNKVVFITRKDLEADFREIIGKRVEAMTEVAYVFQELDDLPKGFHCPAERTKPWGTGQAVLACRERIHEPFVVINADDYYGKEPFQKLHAYLSEDHAGASGIEPICMAGFRLGNTLSENGGVTRGLCDVDPDGRLVRVTETFDIVRTADGAATNEDGKEVPLDMRAIVSMNVWGFRPTVFPKLADGFAEFLAGVSDDELKKEFLLPAFVDELLQSGRAFVDVLETEETWFGVTYQEDKDAVKAALRALTDKGAYPEVF